MASTGASERPKPVHYTSPNSLRMGDGVGGLSDSKTSEFETVDPQWAWSYAAKAVYGFVITLLTLGFCVWLISLYEAYERRKQEIRREEMAQEQEEKAAEIRKNQEH